ncbi:hypothetical protein INR49_025664 [Caranx melampygus]|nr:hypothetical protein INR49_025664 [Caranx melampygus]
MISPARLMHDFTCWSGIPPGQRSSGGELALTLNSGLHQLTISQRSHENTQIILRQASSCVKIQVKRVENVTTLQLACSCKKHNISTAFLCHCTVYCPRRRCVSYPRGPADGTRTIPDDALQS